MSAAAAMSPRPRARPPGLLLATALMSMRPFVSLSLPMRMHVSAHGDLGPATADAGGDIHARPDHPILVQTLVDVNRTSRLLHFRNNTGPILGVRLVGRGWVDIFWNVWGASRHRPHRRTRPNGPHTFFTSAEAFEWFTFGVAMLVCSLMTVYYELYGSRTRTAAVFKLVAWLAMGALYMFLLWFRLGEEAASLWLTGYILEFVFSLENIFVFLAVVKSFRMPVEQTQIALLVVVVGQILFEAVFFMGLAEPLRSLNILPYVLGLWLVYVGVEASRSDFLAEDVDANFADGAICRFCKRVLGGRFLPQYDGSKLFADSKGQCAITLFFFGIVSLLLVDFLLEVDVTLTKIEDIDNHYICFSSSAVAAFMVPTLFFLAKDLFERFFLLQYGISFVLIFFGGQMLLNELVTITPIESVAIIFVVLLLCIATSDVARGWLGKPEGNGCVAASEPEQDIQDVPRPLGRS